MFNRFHLQIINIYQIYGNLVRLNQTKLELVELIELKSIGWPHDLFF